MAKTGEFVHAHGLGKWHQKLIINQRNTSAKTRTSKECCPPGRVSKREEKTRVLIFVVIGHHTIDIPEISLRFLSFAITTFGFSVRVKCYRHA